MINSRVLKYLGLTEDSYYDRLFMIFPRESVTTSIDEWLEDNRLKGIDTARVGENLVISASERGKETLNSTHINAAIAIGAELKSEHVCIGAIVNTSVLSATVPESYDSPNADIFDDEGNVIGRKTVEELMNTVKGTEDKSIIYCSERSVSTGGTGLQMDELDRFIAQFPSYEVFSKKQLATWKAANVLE